MRVFLTLLLLLITIATGSAAQAADSSFRGFIWGVSSADVKKYETAIYYDNRDGLSFFEDTKDGRVIYRYDFQDDKLWRVRVNFMNLSRPYPEEILDVVADTQARLTKQFGKPIDEKLVWKNSTYRRYSKMFPRAFYMQHVRIETEWQKENTNVRLLAYRGDHGYELAYTVENKDAAAAGQAITPFDLFTYNE